MSIHHATIKRASDHDVVLTENEDGSITAQDGGKGDTTITASTAKLALDAVLFGRGMTIEYAAMAIENDLDAEGEPVNDAFVVRHTDGEIVWRGQKVPSLAEVLDLAIAAGVDPESENDEDDAAPTVVVAPLYKRRYAEGGHPEHCGDWLAYQLEGAFLTDPVQPGGEPTFDPTGFADCLVANGVELVGKWADLPTSGQKGWQGRYRMNGRQKLEQRVAAAGVLLLHGETHEVPAEALAVLRDKHPKWAPKAEAEAE